ncbi:MAG: hypothetical protein ACRCUI_08970, partial [Polymorphobacter sp.]
MRIQSQRRKPEFEPLHGAPALALVAGQGGHEPRNLRLGELLVARSALTPEQAEQVGNAQRGSAARFGEAAVALGFVDQAIVDAALASQFDFAVVGPGAGGLDPALSTAHGGRDRASELIRGLRAKLWQEIEARRAADAAAAAITMITVASMTGAVGRRVIAGNLAIAFAQAGTRTLLVDADMRSPALHNLFRLPNKSGLSNYLAGRQPHPDIATIAASPGLGFCAAGPGPPNPAELLARLGAALPRLCAASGATLVLVNAPPFDAADDAYLVASAAPSVLFVARR